MASQASHTSGVPGHLLITLEKADEHRMANFSDKSKLFGFFQAMGDSSIRWVYQKSVKSQHDDRFGLLQSLGPIKK